MLLLWLLIFFKTDIFKNIFQIPSECQSVWIQIRPYVLSRLSLQRLTADDADKESTNLKYLAEYSILLWVFNAMITDKYPDNLIECFWRSYVCKNYSLKNDLHVLEWHMLF